MRGQNMNKTLRLGLLCCWYIGYIETFVFNYVRRMHHIALGVMNLLTDF